MNLQLLFTPKTIYLLLLLTIGTPFLSNAQNKAVLHKKLSEAQLKVATDAKGCIDVGKVYSLRLITSPQGKGIKNEVSGSRHLFPQENNITWIKFKTIRASKLTIRIVPDSISDDYDFLLFKGIGDNTIKEIINRRLKPIRSNCARSQNVSDGVVGLNFDDDLPEHVGAGRGSSFSKHIEVEKDEDYYLVLNNVYEVGAGAIVYLDYWKTKVVSGVVKDENNKPVETDVTWEDVNTGDTLAKTTSDAETGRFQMDVPYTMNAKEGYVLVANSERMVFAETHFTPVQIMTCSPEPIELVLEELKKGKRMTFGSINFVGGQPIFLKSAYPSLRRLHRLLKHNPNMKIKIEGHTNGNDTGTQLLSENRALAVKNYLTEKDINGARMTMEGFGGRYMLYPITSSEEYQSKNRRVEILVTNY